MRPSRQRATRLLPFIGTLWIFITAANLIGLVLGLRSPISDLSLTVALVVLVFLLVHWFGISIDGLTGYLRHYLAPNPILLPFHVLGEITRTLALAVRLFGNMMSLEMAALLVLLVAGLLRRCCCSCCTSRRWYRRTSSHVGACLCRRHLAIP
jgi:F-type H+-transporting ATPase subunit a